MNEAGPVRVEKAGDVAIVWVDNPPVNALGEEVKRGLAAAVNECAANPAIAAAVIACRGRMFFSGADVRELGAGARRTPLAELCAVIGNSPKPVVAAIHGKALGGGLELALSCHGRVSTGTAEFALPEVLLGLIPGAGGVHLLARLAGVEFALRAAVGGKPFDAHTALARGVINEVADGSEAPVASAVDLAARIARGEAPSAPAFDAEDGITEWQGQLERFDDFAAGVIGKMKGQAAPEACAASLRRALAMPFEEALAADRKDFAHLLTGDQSRALRHVFAAERIASRAEAAPGTLQPLRRAGIVGAGTMGGGIALCFAATGIPVTIVDVDEAAVSRGMDRIRANLDASVRRGSLSPAEQDRRLGLITTAVGYQALAATDIVIEAVFEDLALKQELFRALEREVRSDTILATNTSALDVDAIAVSLALPNRFVGMHFFSPANVMRLVEVISTERTAAATANAAVSICRQIGKIPVRAGNCDGFIGNRMVARRGAEAERLLQFGCLPEEVDEAWRSLGFPMGPLQTNDMSGLDIGYAIRKRRGTSFPIADAIVEAGRLGQKVGRGYFRYEAGSRTPLPDPVAVTLIRETAQRLGIAPRTIAPAEMAERMLFPIINEGARILEDGIAARPSDIDVTWVHGYGYPKWRGGPMFDADQIGLGHICRQLERFAVEAAEESLRPSPLLQAMAQDGRTFSTWLESRSSTK